MCMCMCVCVCVCVCILFFFSLLQTLCILANVADGDQAKEYIMSNEDVLKKLMNYMVK